MFNPFAIFDLIPVSNIFGGDMFGLQHQATMPLPDGQIVPTATPGHPETLQHYLKIDGHYAPISREQVGLVQDYLHLVYGAPLPEPGPSPMEVALGLAQPVGLIGVGGLVPSPADLLGAGA